jgi:monoamine oxidase
MGLEPRDRPAKRVIVIGGGIAGLVAAFELVRQGHEPLCCEGAAPRRRPRTIRRDFAGPRGGRRDRIRASMT